MTRRLQDWVNLAERFERGAILVGNGASRAVWPRFNYTSLYEAASSPGVEHPLTQADTAVFEALETTNFEEVLGALRIAGQMAAALGLIGEPYRRRYESIRRALFETVRLVHVPRPRVPDETLEFLAAHLASYQSVYTTNYDLLLYWAILTNTDQFRDYFWAGCFDIADTYVWEGRTRVLYLHGALHLFRNPAEQTCKRTAEQGRRLLDAFTNDDTEPLFVSEGSAEAKSRAIRRSDYLTFAHEQLATEEPRLVIFGQALGPADVHISRALNRSELQIAVALRTGPTAELRAKAAQYETVLPRSELSFFAAESHPLGSADLEVVDTP